MTLIALDDARRARFSSITERRRLEALGRPFPRISYKSMEWPALVMAVLLHIGVAALLIYLPDPDPAAGQSEAISVEIVFAPQEENAEETVAEPVEKTEPPPPEILEAPTPPEPIDEPTVAETTEPVPVTDEALEVLVKPTNKPTNKPVTPKKIPPPKEEMTVTFMPEPPAPRVATPREQAVRASMPRKGNKGALSSQSRAAAINRYTTALQAHLAKNLRYPARARAQRRQGRLEVRLVLNRDGKLVNWEVIASSGQAILDQATQGLVKRAAPFPPFPAEVEADTAGFVVPVRYSLKNM